jgi:hypothetical protein
MNNRKSGEDRSVPARFRHTSFLDLLVDAAYHSRNANAGSDAYEINRAARSSIAAAFLSIECFANGLIDALNAPARLKEDLDKIPALAKIDLALGINEKEPLDRGSTRVQKIADLIKVRNDYVHPKTVTTSAQMHPSEEDVQTYVVPFSVEAKFWPALQIPKYSVLWDASSSKTTLSAVAEFYRHVLIDKLQATDELITKTLLSRFEFSNVLMPAIFDEYKAELDRLSADGIDFSFLNL